MTTQVANIKELWDRVLNEIELTVSKAVYSTWFKDTYIQRDDEGTIFLSVPNQFARDWLFTKYHKDILRFLRQYAAHVRAVEYVITKEPARRREERSRTHQTLLNPRQELPFESFYISREDNLNPRYDFESFVIGPFNELATAAAQAVVRNPGVVYNPLFIYGGTGHGKTHLLQAVGNQIKTNDPNKKIHYMTSERFTVELINAIQQNRANQFKEKYRKYDVLIMDDIQFLSNKEKTQEELFHLFNHLYDNNKQIIFSSDKHPNYIQNLEERLQSRFGAGMIVDIPTPDHESRAAILREKARRSGLDLDMEALDHLATVIDSNIRELEGALNAIICQTELKGRPLSLTEIKSLTRASLKPRRQVAVKDIVRAVATFFDVDEQSIYEKTRKKEIVKPRQLIMYILREDYGISYPAIGQKLGGRDHTTVIHSCEKIKTDLKDNQDLLEEINQIRAML